MSDIIIKDNNIYVKLATATNSTSQNKSDLTIVEVDVNDACPHCGDLNYSLMMIYCVKCDTWFHLEHDNCTEPCEHEECSRDVDWYSDTDFICKNCRNTNNNNDNSNNEQKEDGTSNSNRIMIKRSTFIAIIKRSKIDIIQYCDYQLKGIDDKVKFPKQYYIELKAYGFDNLLELMAYIVIKEKTKDDLKNEGFESMLVILRWYKKDHDIDLTEDEFRKQHNKFRIRLFNLFRQGWDVLKQGWIDKSFAIFSEQLRRVGVNNWNWKCETIRLFFTRYELYNGIHEYLEVFDFVHCQDCTESSCERWVSIIANLLLNRFNLKIERLEKHCVNKSEWKPESIEIEDQWISTCIEEYRAGKHLPPFVVSSNFKYLVSSTIDKLLKEAPDEDACKDFDLSKIDDE